MKAHHVLYQELQDREQDEHLTSKYRSVFGTESGIEVLADILRDLGVMQNLDPHNPVPNALRNYAENILLAKVGKTKFMAALGYLFENLP